MKYLYTTPLPEASATSEKNAVAQQLAKNGLINGGGSAVETVSSSVPDLLLEGQYRFGEHISTNLARSLRELSNGSLGPLPIYHRDKDWSDQGYYVVEQAEIEPLHPKQQSVWKYSVTLSKSGTQSKFWRSVRTNPQTADNPFGSATAPEIGLSIRARKVQWFDDVGGAIGEATPQRRVEGEHDYLDIYDASEPPFDNPVLIYDIPYNEEYKTNCEVRDTYNRDQYRYENESDAIVGDATVGSATVSKTVRVGAQHQRVYVTDHDWAGDMVLETDRLRLVIDQPEDVLRAYRWSPTDGQWTLVQLGASDWRLYDVDLTTVGLARIEAQLEFEDLSTGDRHSLNATLVRGLDEVIWTVPSNESTPPQNLLDRLAPIAATTDRVPAPTQDVIKRTEVDR